MKILKFTGAVLLAAGMLAGCATTAEAPKKDLTEPEMAKAVGDPNPFADYKPAMASTEEYPLTVNWQDAHRAEVDAATSVEAVKKLVVTAADADRLLGLVKEAYKTDPLVQMQIAAVSQLSMCTKWEGAPALRRMWTDALLRAAEKANDDYRRLYYLDQLRWCGRAEQRAAIQAFGAKHSKAVRDFAVMTAKQISR